MKNVFIVLFVVFVVESNLSSEWQAAVIEACNNAQNPPARAADYKEAVLDAVKIWE